MMLTPRTYLIFKMADNRRSWAVSCRTSVVRFQGPRSKFSSGGAKEECVKENFWEGVRGGRHACGFLFNFSTVTENANNDKTIDFFPHLQ